MWVALHIYCCVLLLKRAITLLATREEPLYIIEFIECIYGGKGIEVQTYYLLSHL